MEENFFKKNELTQTDFEDRQNLNDFFGLLLTIDRRINPDFYESRERNNKNIENYDRHNNIRD